MGKQPARAIDGGGGMSLGLILGCFWVLAAAVTAMLPMRAQMVPGIMLLAVTPVLLGLIAWQDGVIWFVIATLAFVSMFRNPLIYFWRRARGLPVTLPSRGEQP
jgi:hypothetical protein